MSRAEVRRDGLHGVRPGREARNWSHDGTPAAFGGSHHDHPGGSYYGEPIINAPVWEELHIAGYLFTGGLAGASSILAAGADLSGRPRLARRAKLCASAATVASLAALIGDLGRPGRFLNMMRVVKPTSPMSIGTWLLAAYAPLGAAAMGSDVLGVMPRTGRVASAAAGLLGSGVATYTGALVANTAVPAWHGGRRELPFLFAGSAASAAAGFGLLAAPASENAPARRMAVLGAAGELAASITMERRLGMVAGALAEEPDLPRPLAAAAGTALLAGSALTRFGLFAAGMASARDPRYTVEPQRARLRERPQPAP